MAGDSEETTHIEKRAHAQAIQAWALFSYHLYKHSGWLSRRNDKWTYIGNAAWKCDVSLDLDTGCFQDYFVKYYLRNTGEVSEGKTKEDDPTLMELDIFKGSIANIPLMEMSKNAQFLSFDIRDREGKPMHLLPRSQCAQVCLNMLIGAIATEHGEGASCQLPPLLSTNPLSAVLAEWFRAPAPPHDNSGLIDEKDPDCINRVHNSFLEAIDILANERGTTSEIVSEMKKNFDSYFDNSPIFKYFVVNYAFRWLVCTCFDCGNDDYSIVKFSYTSSRDIFGKINKGGKGLVKNLYFKGLRAEFDLDNMGYAEVSHTTIVAPEGLRFAPMPFPKAETMCGFNGSSWFHVKDEHLPSHVLDDHLKGDRDVSAPDIRGTLTPSCATIKALYPWKDDNSARLRRLPVEGCAQHKYVLELMLSPKLGTRAIGQTALILFSLAAFLMCLIDPNIYSGEPNFSFSTLLVFVPIVIAVITIRDELSYMRKKISCVPRFLFNVCIVIDVAGFCVLFVAGVCNEAILQLLAAKTPLVGTFLCSAILLIHLVWVIGHFRRDRKWQKDSRAFLTFDVPLV